jgi:hypothetical protein
MDLWRTMGILGFGPQSTSLILHAFPVCQTLSLIDVSSYENENGNTLLGNINSS